MEKTVINTTEFKKDDEVYSKISRKALCFQITKDMLSSVLPNILSGSLVLSLIWGFVYIFFIGVLVFQTVETLTEYFSHPVTVLISLETTNGDVAFPTVTLCNNNILRKSYVKRVSYLQDLAFLDRFAQSSLTRELNFTGSECHGDEFKCQECKDLTPKMLRPKKACM